MCLSIDLGTTPVAWVSCGAKAPCHQVIHYLQALKLNPYMLRTLVLEQAAQAARRCKSAIEFYSELSKEASTEARTIAGRRQYGWKLLGPCHDCKYFSPASHQIKGCGVNGLSLGQFEISALPCQHVTGQDHLGRPPRWIKRTFQAVAAKSARQT